MAITITASSSASLCSLNSTESFTCPPNISSPNNLRRSLAGKLGFFTKLRHHRKPYVLKPQLYSVSSVKSLPMVPPYNVLITGSTKGIDYALAKEFLKAGDNVLICSRSAERVESAQQTLREESGVQHVWGIKCDVRDGNVVNARQPPIHGYIGSNAYSFKPLAEASDEDLIEVVTTNTLGLMICCLEAMKMMLNQPSGGHIFNIDGAGPDGRPNPRFAAYGATKRSVVHLTKSLQRLAFGARRNRYLVEK